MEVILMIKKDEIGHLFLRLTMGANIFLHGFSRLIGDHAAFLSQRLACVASEPNGVVRH
jgi:hypothetical protein